MFNDDTAKDKFEKINNENEIELADISSDEDNEFVPIKKERLIVLYVFKIFQKKSGYV